MSKPRKIYWKSGTPILCWKGALYTSPSPLPRETTDVVVDDESSPTPSVGGIEWVYQMHQPKRGEPAPKPARAKAVKVREPGLRRDREINQTFKDVTSRLPSISLPDGELPDSISYFEDYLHRNIAFKGSREHLLGLRKLLESSDRVHGIIYPDPRQEIRQAPESWAEIGRGERLAINKGYLPCDIYVGEFSTTG